MNNLRLFEENRPPAENRGPGDGRENGRGDNSLFYRGYVIRMSDP